MSQFNVNAQPISAFTTFGEGAPAQPEALPGTPAAPIDSTAQTMAAFSQLSATLGEAFIKKGVKDRNERIERESAGVLDDAIANGLKTIPQLVDSGQIQGDSYFSARAAARTQGSAAAGLLGAAVDRNSIVLDMEGGKLGLLEDGTPVTLVDQDSKFAAWYQGKLQSLQIPDELKADPFFLETFEAKAAELRLSAKNTFDDLMATKRRDLVKGNQAMDVRDAVERQSWEKLTMSMQNEDYRFSLGNQGTKRNVGIVLIDAARQGSKWALDALKELKVPGSSTTLLNDKTIPEVAEYYDKYAPQIDTAIRVKTEERLTEGVKQGARIILDTLQSAMSGEETGVPDLMIRPEDMQGLGLSKIIEQELGPSYEVVETQNGLTITGSENGIVKSEEYTYKDLYETSIQNVAAAMTSANTAALLAPDSGYMGSILAPQDEAERQEAARYTAEANTAITLAQTGYVSGMLKSGIERGFTARGDIARFPVGSDEYTQAMGRMRLAYRAGMDLLLADPDGSTLRDHVGSDAEADYYRALFLYTMSPYGERVGDDTGFALFMAKSPDDIAGTRFEDDVELRRSLASNLDDDSPIGVTESRLLDLAKAVHVWGGTTADQAIDVAYTHLKETSVVIGGRSYFSFDFGPSFLRGNSVPTRINDEGIIEFSVNGQRLLNELVIDLQERGLDHPSLSRQIADNLTGAGSSQGMDFYIKPVPSRPGYFQIFMDEGNDGTIGDTIIMNPKRDDIVFSAEDIVGLLKETGKINERGAFTVDRTGMDQLTDAQKAELDRKGAVSLGTDDLLIGLGDGTAYRTRRGPGGQGLLVDESPRSRQERSTMENRQ